VNRMGNTAELNGIERYEKTVQEEAMKTKEA
jgi:hypothetical protein